VLYFIVDTEGRVTSLSLREPSGDSAFDDYLMSCVAGWRYAPATRDGVPFAIGHKERLSW
jgi:TonB family protein